jgi:hypothetical protein
MRLHLSTRLALLSVVLIAACSSFSGSGEGTPAPDTILYNGKIVTVDGKFSIAEAVAIRGDKFVAVGGNNEVRRLAGAGTRSVDLRGRTVLPGLMDGHLHNAGGGPGVDLSRVRSMDELLAVVAAGVKAGKPGDLVVSNNDWHEAQLKEKRLPHLRDLDRVAPDNPVVLVRGGHEFILNTAAMRRWNITRETKSPDGGEIGRDADGGLNGELVDNARRLVTLPPPPKLTQEAVLEQLRILNASGITSIRIPGSFIFGSDPIETWNMLRDLKSKNQLPVRVNYLLRILDYSSVEKVRETLAKWAIKPDEGDEWLRIGGMKTGVDGGFEGGLMRDAYAEPYGKGGQFKGIRTVPQDKYTAVVRELNRQGWRVATHAVGDAAVDQVLKAYAAADKDQSIKGKRWSIEHFFIARPDQFPRARSLDLVISAQDHLYLAGPSLIQYWGRARAEQVTPVRTFLDQGFLVAGGTDSPVIPYSPFWAMYHFISRETISDGVYGPNQRISREEALRIFTINNAKLTFEESIKGSIEPGKLADLVVVSGDFLTMPEKQLENLKAMGTMVGGRFVYTDPAFSTH